LACLTTVALGLNKKKEQTKTMELAEQNSPKPNQFLTATTYANLLFTTPIQTQMLRRDVCSLDVRLMRFG
jgi:hypothetical protein